jgi:hypothetical protein
MSRNMVNDFQPFRSGCGMCKPSTDYYKIGGNYSDDSLISTKDGKNFYKETDYNQTLDNTFLKKNMGIDYKTSMGGSKKFDKKSGFMDILTFEEMNEMHGGVKKSVKKPVKKTVKKGGFMDIPTFEEMDEMHGGVKKPVKKTVKKTVKKGGFMDIPTFEEMDEMHGGVKKSVKKPVKKTVKKGGFMDISTVEDMDKMYGGMESSGATSMDSRFFNPELTETSYNELSGNSVISAYGPIKSGNIGTGMLAPYTANTKSLNQDTDLRTGGGNKKVSGKKVSGKKVSGKKVSGKKVSGKKSMKGGMESSGATSMDSRFFNPELSVTSYNELSGNSVMSAYGPIKSGNIGTGMLAPYTSSSKSTNQNTDLRTGGSKRNKMKGGRRGPIPEISSGPISNIQGKLTGAMDSFSGFMQKLDSDYLKSVQYTKSIKIGNQRLIKEGGSSKKESSKKESSKKESSKKESSKKESSKKESSKKESSKKESSKKESSKKKLIKKGGGNGSDFALTLNSRGPVNAPDDYWGVPGEQWFRQFNKTGDYIPNSKLAYAATPLLAGDGNNNSVTGYDERTIQYTSV